MSLDESVVKTSTIWATFDLNQVRLHLICLLLMSEKATQFEERGCDYPGE